MIIKLKNKFLYFNEYRVKCSIGKRGITSQKIEGDGKTPRGAFKFKSIFYRKDRVSKIKTQLKKNIINKNMGWCDDTNSKQYNRLVKLPFGSSNEKLWLKENIYDLLIVINYNLRPVVKNKGSAIFLHIARRNYKPTKGCIAISKKDMIQMIKKMDNKSKIIIN